MQYFEGGSLIPNKSPGRLTFSDVTLERGATQDRDLFDWFQDVAITSSGLGLTDVNYKRNLDIVQQEHHPVVLGQVGDRLPHPGGEVGVGAALGPGGVVVQEDRFPLVVPLHLAKPGEGH